MSSFGLIAEYLVTHGVLEALNHPLRLLAYKTREPLDQHG